MLAKRIIPCLDVTGGRVVKGVNFVNLRDAVDPVELADRYNPDGADEIGLLDITRAAMRATSWRTWWRTARKVFIRSRWGRHTSIADAPHPALRRIRSA